MTKKYMYTDHATVELEVAPDDRLNLVVTDAEGWESKDSLDPLSGWNGDDKSLAKEIAELIKDNAHGMATSIVASLRTKQEES